MNMVLPNFLIIGASRSGTTWLANNLRHHPQVFLAAGEPHFFDHASRYARGVEWYQRRFKGADAYKAIGEKTASYHVIRERASNGRNAHVNRLIADLLPNVKLIMTIRNPVDRAVSVFNHHVMARRLPPVLSRIDELASPDKRHLYERYGLLHSGIYYDQLCAYYETFSPEQVLVLVYEEDIVGDPASGLRTVCEFLGVDASFDFPNMRQVINSPKPSKWGLALAYYVPQLSLPGRAIARYCPWGRETAKPTEDTRKKLYDFYAPHNESLFQLLGRRIESWCRPLEVESEPSHYQPQRRWPSRLRPR